MLLYNMNRNIITFLFLLLMTATANAEELIKKSPLKEQHQRQWHSVFYINDFDNGKDGIKLWYKFRENKEKVTNTIYYFKEYTQNVGRIGDDWQNGEYDICKYRTYIRHTTYYHDADVFELFPQIKTKFGRDNKGCEQSVKKKEKLRIKLNSCDLVCPSWKYKRNNSLENRVEELEDRVDELERKNSTNWLTSQIK